MYSRSLVTIHSYVSDRKVVPMEVVETSLQSSEDCVHPLHYTGKEVVRPVGFKPTTSR